MRILVELPHGEIEQLNALSRRRKLSRTELVRQAVCSFLALNRPGLEDSFGLWKGRGLDGVQYQESLRRGMVGMGGTGNSVVPASPALRPSAQRVRLRRGCFMARVNACPSGVWGKGIGAVLMLCQGSTARLKI
jgi:hypothetical protein